MAKRLFDVCFSLFLLLLTAPVFLFLMLLVKCTSSGPIFYKGIRMGYRGQLIYCYKFRTMVQDADAKLQEVLAQDPALREEWKTYFKLKNDPRLTSIGTFLRKSSLDELPQLWNILQGDLSVVGPRPIAIEDPLKADEEIRRHFGEKTDKILSAKPGITCIWLTKGRNLLTFEQRIALEEKYVEQQSLLLDLKIICQTIPAILFSRGAF
jgi:exopolysaccharide production protein ExoY